MEGLSDAELRARTSAFRQQLLSSIRDRVEKYKNNPALRMWGLGNETVHDILVSKRVTTPFFTATVMSLNAGNDMLLGPTGADQMLATINTLKAALQNGTLSKARVDEAATRIIALKMEDHLMPALPSQG